MENGDFTSKHEFEAAVPVDGLGELHAVDAVNGLSAPWSRICAQETEPGQTLRPHVCD